MNDTVDDLHAAEEMASRFAAEAKDLLLWIELARQAGARFPLMPSSHGNLKRLVEEWNTYCRPGCGAEGEAGSLDCEEGDTCGCPCGHADPDEYAAARPG